MFNRRLEEINIGERWVSAGRTITETDLVMFSALSGDWYPLHTDAQWAANTRFGQRIAHGMLMLSVATGLLKIVPGIVLAFYGMDQVRFVRPTFIGETVHIELEALDKKLRADKTGILSVRLDIKNSDEEVKVCSTAKFLMK